MVDRRAPSHDALTVDEFGRQHDPLAVPKFSKSRVWDKVPNEYTPVPLFWRYPNFLITV